jgi:HrpA-like RNA helicase
MEIRVTTNAADTGFTFENSDKEGPVMGVDVIISGIVNHLRVDPETGFAWLEEIEDVRSSLEQQAGRAGRKADGTVIYLMSKDNFDRREYLHTPAILEKDFTDDVLGLINMGVDVRLLAAELDMDISERPIRLAYYPPRKSIERGISKLKILGAIDDNLQKTATGEAMLRFGKDYNFARALVEAQKIGYEEPLVTISLMHAKAPELFLRPDDITVKGPDVEASRESFQIEGSDFLTLLNIWRQYSAQPEDKRQEWAAKHYLDIEMLKDIEVDRARELKQLGVL